MDLNWGDKSLGTVAVQLLPGSKVQCHQLDSLQSQVKPPRHVVAQIVQLLAACCSSSKLLAACCSTSCWVIVQVLF